MSISQTLEWGTTVIATLNGENRVRQHVLDKSMNVISTGDLLGTGDFDPGPGTHFLGTGDQNSWVMKQDQSGQFLWAKAFAPQLGNGGCAFRSVATDDSNNVYAVGQFYGTLIIPSGNFINVGNEDAFIVKLDSNGQFVWAKQIGSNGAFGNVLVWSIDVDGSNNLLITGGFRDTTDFDPDTTKQYLISPSGFENSYVLKLSSNGEFIWVKPFLGNNLGFGYHVSTDNLNNVHFAGQFKDTVDFDPDSSTTFLLDANNSINYNGYYCVLDSNGDFISARLLAENFLGIFNGFDLDRFNNFYFAGNYDDTIDFDPGPGAYEILPYSSADDGFVGKIDKNGNLKWVKSIIGSSRVSVNDVSSDRNGSIYIIGIVNDTLYYDIDTVSNYIVSPSTHADVFYCKLDSMGNIEWLSVFTSDKNERMGTVTPDKFGSIYLSGQYRDTINVSTDTVPYLLGGSSETKYYSYMVKIRDCNRPYADFNYTGHCLKDTTSFMSLSLNIDSTSMYYWDFDGDLVFDDSLMTETSYLYADTGSYTVTLRVINDVGCQSDFSQTIKIDPIDTLYLPTIDICQGDSSLVFGNYEHQPNLFNDTWSNIFGCDSLNFIELIVNPTYQDTLLSSSICLQ